MKPNGTKEKNSHRQDLTDTKLGPNSTININRKPSEEDTVEATITTNHLTIDHYTAGCDQNDNELECDFTEIVRKYMRCEKRTLAEMLAMRDLDEKKRDSGNDMLKKLIESPDTWRVHPEIQPNVPNPYPIDWNDYCYTAPYNRCIRGGGMFKSCIGCPYYQGIFYTRQGQGTGDQNPNGYGYTVSSTNEIVSNKSEKQRLDD